MLKRSVAIRLLPAVAVGLALVLSGFTSTRTPLTRPVAAICTTPSITSVSPSSGPVGGGQTVTINGCGLTGVTAVKFGTTAAGSFAFVADSQITAVSPAHAYGTVDITVTTPGGTSPTSTADQYSFLAGLYTLDGFGGFHPDDSPPITNEAYWSGWRIARSAHPWRLTAAGESGFTLDGYGGLHPYGPSGLIETTGASGHYWGFAIARDFALLPNGTGGVVLDGYGGLHGFGINGGAAPVPMGYAYFGVDVAIKVVIAADGLGGYTLDAYGGLHPFGIGGAAPQASPILNTGYWTWRAAQDIALIPGQSGGYTGYVLDKFGGLHSFAPTGSALPPSITTAYFGFDIARGLFFRTGSSTSGYTLDGYGGPHPFGGAPPIGSYAYWPGYDIAIQLFGA